MQHPDKMPADQIAMRDQAAAATNANFDASTDGVQFLQEGEHGTGHPGSDYLFGAFKAVNQSFVESEANWCSHMRAAYIARNALPAWWLVGTSQLRCEDCHYAYLRRVGVNYCVVCDRAKSRCCEVKAIAQGLPVTIAAVMCPSCRGGLQIA